MAMHIHCTILTGREVVDLFDKVEGKYKWEGMEFEGKWEWRPNGRRGPTITFGTPDVTDLANP